MNLFNGKYRIISTRLHGWDYSRPGLYFVTICTQNMVPLFGELINKKVHLSPIGEIVAEEWVNTETIRPNVQLDAWVIMPNHMHMFIETKHTVETPRRDVFTNTTPASNKWGPNTLGSIIGPFKGKCTKRIRAQGYHDFAWQPRFYDRIIRSETMLHNVRQYIITNPTRSTS